MIRTTYVADSGGGVVRHTNQDNFYINGMTKPVDTRNYRIGGTSTEPYQVFAVCDGMGGEQAGEVAAALAVETLKEQSQQELCFHYERYIVAANEKICAYQREHQLRMGTTFAGLFLRDGQAQAVNVGDSRIYRIRKGQITQLSRDHNHVQTMIDAGILTKEAARHHKARNQLTQHLGIEASEMELMPFVTEWMPVEYEDRYLICSDGLCEGVSDEELVAILQKEPTLTDCCRNLIACAEKQGSRDNITVLLIGVSEESEPQLAPPVCEESEPQLAPLVCEKPELLLALPSEAEAPVQKKAKARREKAKKAENSTQRSGRKQSAKHLSESKYAAPHGGKRCKKSRGRHLAEVLGLRRKEQ